MIIRARAPLRLGLAGGGTDVSAYCSLHGGYVLNATVSMYAYAILEPRNDGRVRFVAADRQEVYEGEASEVDPTLDGVLALHKGVFRRIVNEFNGGRPVPMTLTTYSDVPAGSGLGSSSTMVVAMVTAFRELLGLPFGEYDIAHLAYEIERLDMGLNGGKQDHYAATFGGVNFIEFYPDDRVVVNPLRIKDSVLTELEASLILYFTGVSRDSAAIIDEQTANLKAENPRSLEAMKQLKNDALEMKEAILRGDLVRFARVLGRSWEAKKKAASRITNPEIDHIYRLALKAGAYSGKVSGAGGGGFMMFVVDPAKRPDVLRALEHESGTAMGCHFTKRGSEGWRVT
jgi:D-glycero-alpha-D-manno-heptose-7-phosphate kinase